jgi:hypothetical protein
VSVGFAPSKTDPLTRLRKAYRLCSQATVDIERCRAERRPREKAEYLARAVVAVRNIQAEIEAAGILLKENNVSGYD